MTTPSYRTAPDHRQTTWPSGIPYIIGNEGCERFSYYGMNAILYIYVVSLYTASQIEHAQAADWATETVHWFKTGVYAFPMIGAIIADRLLGKYQTIFWVSLVYCLGHVVLSFSEGSILGLYAGLFLIAVGSGGIKPCVSAHVGDQFGKSNWYLISKVYQAFYFIINFGSFFAVLGIPLLQKWFGWRVAFLVPGILMFIATWVFWLGRKHFVHVPPRPGGQVGFLDTLSSIFLFMTVGSLFITKDYPSWVMGSISVVCFFAGIWLFQIRQKQMPDDGFLAVCLFSAQTWLKQLLYGRLFAFAMVSAGRSAGGARGNPLDYKMEIQKRFSEEAIEGTRAVWRIISVFFMVSVFWALFDQHSSSWIYQAEMMNLTLALPWVGHIELLPSQIPSLNPVMVMVLIPILSYGVYPWLQKKGFNPSPLKRMTVGMLIASLSFVSVALLQHWVDKAKLSGESISVLWQIGPYLLITLAEVLVSITGLEFAYSQAPKRMKSTIMGFWLLTVSIGNALVALLAHFSDLPLAQFFWIFAGLMACAGVIFGIRASFYQVRDYPQ